MIPESGTDRLHNALSCRLVLHFCLAKAGPAWRKQGLRGSLALVRSPRTVRTSRAGWQRCSAIVGLDVHGLAVPCRRAVIIPPSNSRALRKLRLHAKDPVADGRADARLRDDHRRGHHRSGYPGGAAYAPGIESGFVVAGGFELPIEGQPTRMMKLPAGRPHLPHIAALGARSGRVADPHAARSESDIIAIKAGGRDAVR
jgi:hypothetical protein